MTKLPNFKGYAKGICNIPRFTSMPLMLQMPLDQQVRHHHPFMQFHSTYSLCPQDRADSSKSEARTVLVDFTLLLVQGGESDRKQDSLRVTSYFKVTL